MFAPGVYSPGYAPYTTAHNIIRSHAKAYRLYDRKYRSTQNGIVGITLSTEWAEPKDPNNPDDVAAADRFLQVGIIGYLIFNVLYLKIANRDKFVV